MSYYSDYQKSFNSFKTQQYKTEEEEIIETYEEIEKEALNKMLERSRGMEFNWRKLIDEGIRRRRSMDVKLKMHRIKLMQVIPSSLFSINESCEGSGLAEESTQ